MKKTFAWFVICCWLLIMLAGIVGIIMWAVTSIDDIVFLLQTIGVFLGILVVFGITMWAMEEIEK